MSPYIAFGVTGIAYMGLVVIGAYTNYRFIKRIAEREDSQ